MAQRSEQSTLQTIVNTQVNTHGLRISGYYSPMPGVYAVQIDSDRAEYEVTVEYFIPQSGLSQKVLFRASLPRGQFNSTGKDAKLGRILRRIAKDVTKALVGND